MITRSTVDFVTPAIEETPFLMMPTDPRTRLFDDRPLIGRAAAGLVAAASQNAVLVADEHTRGAYHAHSRL